MTRILLASTAIVAFAGAAAADGHAGISFTGSATLGYNDTVAAGGGDNEFGLYSDLDIVANFAATLDNGLTAAASINLDDLVGNPGSNNGLDYELSLTSETAGLYYGDTAFAAETHWVDAGDMDVGFSEADGETALRGDLTFGSVSASISYADRDANGLVSPTGDLEQLSIGAAADFGNINVTMGYQEAAVTIFTGNGDFVQAEVFGISAGTTFGGADVRLAYAESNGADSLGVSVSYPFGPVTVDASYSMESAADDNWNIAATYANGPISVKIDTDESDSWGIEGSYDVGNGLMVFAGLDDAGEDMYVGGEYDLGSGASLLVSYATDDDADNGDDEIGAKDYQEGATVEISFDF